MSITFQRINFLDTPNQRQRVTLDGTEYVLKFRWRERTQGWYISIYHADESETPIVEGRRLKRFANAVEFQEDEFSGYLFADGPSKPDVDEPDDVFRVIYAHE